MWSFILAITSLTDFIPEIVLPVNTVPPSYVSAKRKPVIVNVWRSLDPCPMHLVVISILAGGHLNCVYGSSPSQDLVDILGSHLKEKK